MRPSSCTGPPGLQVQREFEDNRLARDSQAGAYQKVFPVVRSETRTRVTDPVGKDPEETLVGQEGVAA
jgi:hypothetical protein